MNPDKKEKLVRFIRDEKMSAVVKEVLSQSFLKNSNSKEVNVLAAERIAINLLEDAWKELLKYKSEGDEISTVGRQIGL